MVRVIFISLCILVSSYSFSQEESFIRKGLLRAQGTISFGSGGLYDGLFLHGNLEYYTNNKTSARSDIYYMLKTEKTWALEANHQLFSGGSFHLLKNKNFDPYLGLQPGIAINQLSKQNLEEHYPNQKSNLTLTPLISPVFGFNYYASNWFHLFIDARVVLGKYLSEVGPLNINEFRFSFGLGFNINTK